MAVEKRLPLSETREAVMDYEDDQEEPEGWFCFKCGEYVEAKINDFGFPLCPKDGSEVMWID